MATLAGQSRAAPGHEHRTVLRSRLLQILDQVREHTVLLVAPAGYGKTTLARQWVERAGGAWVWITPASRDVPVLARDLASAISSIGGLDLLVVEKALRAGASPMEQARGVARVILSHTPELVDSWIVLDDYHLLAAGSAADELVSLLERSGRFRFLVTSRDRPSWATTRRRLYMETFELRAPELALDEHEVAELLPPDRRTVALRSQARGWPAVIALAAHSRLSDVPITSGSLSPELYDYFAEELFEAAPPEVQRCLTAVAILPPLDSRGLASALEHEGIAETLSATGLVYEAEGQVRVHPLARDFLVARARDQDDARDVAAAAFDLALGRGLYDEAFRVLSEFDIDARLERLITSSYGELIESGRLATLERFARYAKEHGDVALAVTDAVSAEAALARGDLDKAASLAASAYDVLAPQHPLKARTYIVGGNAVLLAHRHAEALTLFRLGARHATTKSDLNDATWGRCLAALLLEDDEFEEALRVLESSVAPRRADRVRLDNIRTFGSIIRGEKLRDGDPEVARLVPLVADPRVRSHWGFIHGSALVLQARYKEAEGLLRLTMADLDEFKLSFAMPHVEWALAASELGQRHFARCEALLRRVERRLASSPNLFIELNIRSLRARLHIVQQRPRDAIEITADDFDDPPGKSMYGEYLATRALARAVIGEQVAALADARAAEQMTMALDTRVLCAATRALLACRDPDSSQDAVRELVGLASASRVWDGLVCAVRASPQLLAELMKHPRHRNELREVLLRSNDLALAKAAGLVTRVTGSSCVLTNREREIMEHLRQGKRNAEIAASLFITLGTVKRHLDHIYRKLGARGRAEAIARYAEIESGAAADV